MFFLLCIKSLNLTVYRLFAPLTVRPMDVSPMCGRFTPH